MQKRGPHHQSIFEKDIRKKRIIFLNSGLSIIDLGKRTNQPFIKDNLIILMLKKIISNHHLKVGDHARVLCRKLINKRGKIIEFYSTYILKLLLESLSRKITAILPKKSLCFLLNSEVW